MVSVLSLDTNLRSLLPFVESTGKCLAFSMAVKHFFSNSLFTDWLIDFHSVLFLLVVRIW